MFRLLVIISVLISSYTIGNIDDIGMHDDDFKLVKDECIKLIALVGLNPDYTAFRESKESQFSRHQEIEIRELENKKLGISIDYHDTKNIYVFSPSTEMKPDDFLSFRKKCLELMSSSDMNRYMEFRESKESQLSWEQEKVIRRLEDIQFKWIDYDTPTLYDDDE